MYAYLKINLVKAFALSFIFRSIVLAVNYGGLAFVFYYYGDMSQGLLCVYLARSAIVSIMLTFLLVIVIQRIARRRFLEMFSHMEWVKFALLPLCSFVMFAGLAAAFQYTGMSQQAKVLAFLAIGLRGINILVYFLLLSVFVVTANDLSGIWLEDQDIVVILSNLLDNAIEAAQTCEKKRVLRLKMILEEDLIISVQNTYSGNTEIVDGKLHTSKPDKEEHGIGIPNIIEAVEKYQGAYAIKAEHGEFLFSILIPKGP